MNSRCRYAEWNEKWEREEKLAWKFINFTRSWLIWVVYTLPDRWWCRKSQRCCRRFLPGSFSTNLAFEKYTNFRLSNWIINSPITSMETVKFVLQNVILLSAVVINPPKNTHVLIAQKCMTLTLSNTFVSPVIATTRKAYTKKKNSYHLFVKLKVGKTEKNLWRNSTIDDVAHRPCHMTMQSMTSPTSSRKINRRRRWAELSSINSLHSARGDLAQQTERE